MGYLGRGGRGAKVEGMEPKWRARSQSGGVVPKWRACSPSCLGPQWPCHRLLLDCFQVRKALGAREWVYWQAALEGTGTVDDGPQGYKLTGMSYLYTYNGSHQKKSI